MRHVDFIEFVSWHDSRLYPGMELIVYGLAAGETERWKETLLAATCRTDTDVAAVKAAASKDGWHSFRVARWNGEAPDFTKVLRK